MTSNQLKHWVVSPPISQQVDAFLAPYSPIMRQILFNRGCITEVQARAFLKAEADFDPSPFQLTGVPATVDRIRYALEHDEGIAIYGDYDVDGVTATALMVQSLRSMGGNVEGYIPNRFDEGYGLNNEALDLLNKRGIKLVISVDCGIRSPAEAVHARAIGLDLIITDHHQPQEGDLPFAFAVVNPKQPGDMYPDKNLAGVGVAYKIIQAVMESMGNSYEIKPADLLDLVALGTVADLAPLKGENRILVRAGLNEMRHTKRQGLFSLAAVADLSLSQVTSTSIGYVLGPRLNAAGRLESALAAFELLTTTDVKIAGSLAQQLNIQNRQRQEITRFIQSEAEKMVLTDDPTADLVFAVRADFNAGVVGLAASRLVETFYRPAVVGQISDDTTRCSCRSIPEFNITEALDQCKDLLVRHGGHAAAAGFTVSNENLIALKNKLIKLATKQLGSLDLRPTLKADVEVSLSDLKGELLQDLQFLQPTGLDNPEAVFVTRGLHINSSKSVGVDGKHLKLVVSDGSVTFDAIGFRLGHLKLDLPDRVDLLYTFESNEFNGRTSLQLNLKDIRPANYL